jgi:hypothetical protein
MGLISSLYYYRWLDKGVVVTVAKNGKTVVNFEHATSVGITVGSYVREAYNDSVNKPSITPDARPSAANSSVRKLSK